MNRPNHIDIKDFILQNDDHCLVAYTPRGIAFLGTDRVLGLTSWQARKHVELAKNEGLNVLTREAL